MPIHGRGSSNEEPAQDSPAARDEKNSVAGSQAGEPENNPLRVLFSEALQRCKETVTALIHNLVVESPRKRCREEGHLIVFKFLIPAFGEIGEFVKAEDRVLQIGVFRKFRKFSEITVFHLLVSRQKRAI